MEILFISNTMSRESYETLYKIRNKKRIEPSQKFFDLILNGMAEQDVNIHCLSVIPVYHEIYPKFVIKKKLEQAAPNKCYEYIGFLNYPLLKQVSVYYSVGKAIKKWIKKSKGRERVIVVDPMLVEVTHKALKLAKKSGVKITAFVTDVPSLTFSAGGRLGGLKRLYLNISDNDLSKFDAYILLTEQMNELFNKEKKENLLIESVVPCASIGSHEKNKTNEEFQIMYAGKLHKKFGVNSLVDAMKFIDKKNVKLLLYGDGDSVDYIKNAARSDARIEYRGVVPVTEVEKIIRSVSLLINPRPNDSEFVKYSFPSKTVEYLLSGTPFASVRLPGIPREYYNYIVPIEKSDPIVIADAINDIMDTDYDALTEKAEQGQRFVLERKNNKIQGKKIIDFLSRIC